MGREIDCYKDGHRDRLIDRETDRWAERQIDRMTID